MRLRVLHSLSHNPWFNLAVEDCIFRQLPADQCVLFLWQNADTVVIGRSQNPWKECNTRVMERDGVKLARRQSGGGAVFHDLGNTCFTFMAGKPGYDKVVSTGIILESLRSLGISAAASGRNDIVVEVGDSTRKVSGSAYKETSDRGFHHGTLLLHSDLGRLADYLNPDPKKLQSKGVSSVVSRVANLGDFLPGIDHERMSDAVREAFFAHYGTRAHIEYISPEQMPDLPRFEEQFAFQSSWQWNFGDAPSFTHVMDERFPWAGIELHFDVDRGGHISRAKVFTDSMNPTPLEDLETRLPGTLYQPEALAAVLAEWQDVFSDMPELAEVAHWLVEQLR